MLTFYTSADTLIEEQDQFEKDIAEFVAGNIDPVKFKAIRVAHGVYEQRQADTYMIRIRCAASGITPRQLRKVAELGTKYGSGEVHFTTRQEVQVHNVLIEGVMPVIRGLNEVKLSSRGGGGNTIRNILTSPLSGISEDDVFDVDPYASALTTRMIHEPDSWNLPRKFKINFSNNAQDTTYTQATCLGFVAKMQNGQKGFEVYCAGGMGAKPMVGSLLFDFIPDTRAYHVTKALKIMFDKHGNRRSKFSSRIKFLWRKLERDEFIRLFEEEYNKLKDDDSLALKLPIIENKAEKTNLTIEEASGTEFETWKKRYLFKQKQAGLWSIKVPLRLGDLLEEDAYTLCDFVEHFGENTIRCERGQNIQLRNIPEAYLGNAFNVISSLKETLTKFPYFISSMINCTGASTCKLGICLPRGLSDEIRDHLEKTDIDFDKIPNFKLNMSGCPNTCGMHHVADLGFFGKVGRKDGSMYPAYNILAGAKVGESGKTEFAKKAAELPVHHIPEFVEHFLRDYVSKKEKYETYQNYLDSEGIDKIKSLCTDLKEIPSFEDNPKYYTDFGAKKPISLDELGSAECSAGMFDMIDVDKKSIKANKKLLTELSNSTEIENSLYKILYAASRMLLVTRGLDANSDQEVFEYFAKHFIQTNLVDATFMDIVTLGKLGVKAELPKHQDNIIKLAETVEELYKNMDDSLRFKVEPKNETKLEEESSTNVNEASIVSKDYRGVGCPMNFVKTKLVLETIQSGELLEILLDDGAPIQNVPNSVKLEGHKVLEQERKDEGHWRVLIQKA